MTAAIGRLWVNDIRSETNVRACCGVKDGTESNSLVVQKVCGQSSMKYGEVSNCRVVQKFRGQSRMTYGVESISRVIQKFRGQS